MSRYSYKVLSGKPEEIFDQLYLDTEDISLIQTFEVDTDIEQGKDKVELHIYSLENRLLFSDQNFSQYSVIRGGSKKDGKIDDITLDPQRDAINEGFPNGDVNLLYNFTRNLFAKNGIDSKFYISNISPDRTELRLASTEILDQDIVSIVQNLKNKFNEDPYFEDLRLNFGKSNLPIVINVNSQTQNDTTFLLVKLYEPLGIEFEVKNKVSLEQLVGDSILFRVITEAAEEVTPKLNYLRGPNFEIELADETNNPSEYLNFNELLSYPVTNNYYELYSLVNDSGSSISIDHTSFSDFIHFSSAEERLKNFRYKLQLIESNETLKNRTVISGRNETGSYDKNIENIVRKFDHYDRFLYYESGSFSWPKSNSNRPYTLFPTTSSEAISWYSSLILSASNFDDTNKDRLIGTIPAFLREDPNNRSYEVFLDMIGQHFDNIWIYQKAVTDKYDADNRLNYGISKDLVKEALINFGVKLYESNQSLENLFTSFIGQTYDSGSENINNTVVALSGSVNSYLQPVPKDFYLKEIYKRIYHNLPLLLKGKGTERGLRTLINCYGIPSDILDIKLFGGGDRDSRPFYGFLSETTSSLDKIKIETKEGILSGSTLSSNVFTVSGSTEYVSNLHTVEVGFSPSTYVNSYIRSNITGSFNIDNYIGDTRSRYSGSYKELNSYISSLFTSGSGYIEPYDVFDFVRLIKFYDNSIFRAVKEFIPARANLKSGIIIKPHLLERSKNPDVKVKWSNQNNKPHLGTDLEYTGSSYIDNFYFDGTIDTAFITGSHGLEKSLDSSYSTVYANISGGFSSDNRNNQNEPLYNGEFDGSTIVAADGELNRSNLVKINDPYTFLFRFKPIKFLTLYAHLVNSPNTGSAILACQGTKNVILYGLEPIFENNTLFYTDLSGTVYSNPAGFWISNGQYALQTDGSGNVINTSLCSPPQTRYTFANTARRTTLTDACNNKSSGNFTITGFASSLVNNQLFFSGSSYSVLDGGGDYFAYTDGNYVRIAGSLVIESGSCPTPASPTPTPTVTPSPSTGYTPPTPTPTITPTPSPSSNSYSFTIYQGNDSTEACSNASTMTGTPATVYGAVTPFNSNARLYTDPGLTTAFNGNNKYWSDGTYYALVSISGLIADSGNC